MDHDDQAHQQLHPHFEHAIRIFLGVLIVLLAVLCVLLFRQYHYLRQAGMTGIVPHVGLEPHTAGAMSDVDSLQSWMTYDYISHIYALPPDYLRASLNIADTRYPHVTIAESADAQGESAAALLAAVKSAVTSYLASNQQNTQQDTRP